MTTADRSTAILVSRGVGVPWEHPIVESSALLCFGANGYAES